MPKNKKYQYSIKHEKPATVMGSQGKSVKIKPEHWQPRQTKTTKFPVK